MIFAQEVGAEVMIKPQSATTNAAVEGYIDTKDADYLSVNFALDTQASTASKPQVMKLQESDETQSFVDIPEMEGDGADPGAFTIPDADTDNPQVVRLNLDLLGRKRYINAVLQTGGATQLVSVTGSLSRASSDIRDRNAAVHDA